MQRKPTWGGTEFTESELRQALALVMNEEQIEEMLRPLNAPGETAAVLTPETLLLLSTVSESTAAKALRVFPGLEHFVKEIRANPASWAEVVSEYSRIARPPAG